MKSTEFDVNNLLEEDDPDLKEELQACQHFLVDSQLEKGRHRVLNFAMSTFYNSSINKKLDSRFKGINCAAKVNLAFGFVHKSVQDRSWRYFYAHENDTVMERLKLCVHQTTLPIWKRNYRKSTLLMFVHERERERAITKWKFYKLTNLTVFAALLKDVPMGLKIPYYLNHY